jgi:hypothetical protein
MSESNWTLLMYALFPANIAAYRWAPLWVCFVLAAATYAVMIRNIVAMFRPDPTEDNP